MASGNPVIAVGLDMLLPAYLPATQIFLPVDMHLTAVSTSLVSFTGIQYEQSGFNGTLSYSWFDPGLAATVNLLTVAFTGAILNVDLGATPSGSFFATAPLQWIVYTSDVFDMSQVGEADFSLSFSAISKAFSVKDGYGDSFQANVVATFAAAVPEPASWAMMIAGFGMVGFAARRRRNQHSVNA